MLRLDAARWSSLMHAFGSAEDVPDLLRQLELCAPLPRRWQDEPLRSLWDRLCHQATPDVAAFAAVPHLVRIAEAAPPNQRTAVLHLVGAIASYDDRAGEPPADLSAAYEAALARTRRAVEESLAWLRSDERQVMLLIADLAALDRERLVARSASELAHGEVQARCPRCGVFLGELGAGDEGILISPLEWARERVRSSYGNTARDLAQDGVARRLDDLVRPLRCPSCGQSSTVAHAAVVA